jgi:hypothetical protein
MKILTLKPEDFVGVMPGLRLMIKGMKDNFNDTNFEIVGLDSGRLVIKNPCEGIEEYFSGNSVVQVNADSYAFHVLYPILTLLGAKVERFEKKVGSKGGVKIFAYVDGKRFCELNCVDPWPHKDGRMVMNTFELIMKAREKAKS